MIRFLLVLGCTVASLLAQGKKSDPPLVIPDSVQMHEGVTYATVNGKALKLDLFVPKAGAGPFPAVVYVHGGGWSGGTRTQFHRHAAHMAAKGFVGACVQYRLSGEAIYPAALHDVKAAVRWLRANAKQHRVRTDRIGAAGGSAGGHLVALLGVTNDNPAYEGTVGVTGPSSAVQAVAGFNPALDMVGFGKQRAGNATASTSRFLGKTYDVDPEIYRIASPIAQANAKAPPTLLLHGDADTTVPHQQSVEFQKALRSKGVKAELVTAPGAGHGFFNRPPWFEPMLRHMDEFFSKTLR